MTCLSNREARADVQETRLRLAFAMCYVTAHYVLILILIDHREAESMHVITSKRIWIEG